MNATNVSKPRIRRVGVLLRRVVHATLERLSSPSRDPSLEYYRFPWF